MVTMPRITYLICATPRSGSFLLCEALKSTGLAGRPEEYFWRDDEPFWRERWGARSYAAYVEAALREGTTPNGVWGAKLMWGYAGEVAEKLRGLPGNDALPMAELLARSFPNLSYIHVTRRDRVRQAVSFAKAIQTGVWASSEGIPPVLAREPEYDGTLIDHLVREVAEHDRMWGAYFREAGVAPLRVVYEDLVPTYEVTARRVLRHLGIEPPSNLELAPRRMRRQANALSEKWVRRYRAEVSDPGAGFGANGANSARGRPR